MIRHAERPLTSSYGGGVPAIKLGRRPGKPDDMRIKYAWHLAEDGTRVRTSYEVPSPHRGQPAVSIDQGATRSGSLAYEDPAALREYARELLAAADWLEAKLNGDHTLAGAIAAAAARRSQ